MDEIKTIREALKAAHSEVEERMDCDGGEEEDCLRCRLGGLLEAAFSALSRLAEPGKDAQKLNQDAVACLLKDGEDVYAELTPRMFNRHLVMAAHLINHLSAVLTDAALAKAREEERERFEFLAAMWDAQGGREGFAPTFAVELRAAIKEAPDA